MSRDMPDGNYGWPTRGHVGYITPAVGGVAAKLRSGGKNQKWSTSGRIGYITLAVSGVPNASERGTKSEVAHKWAGWLHDHCRVRVGG